MAKFHRRRFYRGARDKYSVEHTAINVTTAAAVTNFLYQAAVNVCASSPTQGMRKIKHITATLTLPNANQQLYWAIVFVPEGYSANTMNANPGASLYEPNQFVMACGVNDPDAGPIRIHSPVSRNLNSGDSVWLIVGSSQPTTQVCGVVQYAITLQ